MYSERGALKRDCQNSWKAVGRVPSTLCDLGVWLRSWLRAQSRFRVMTRALRMRNSSHIVRVEFKGDTKIKRGLLLGLSPEWSFACGTGVPYG